MKRTIRMTAILTAVVMILSMAVCVFAEEDPLYVSPGFKIPENRIISDPWPSDEGEKPEGEQPEEGETPTEDEQPEEGETPTEDEQPEEGKDPVKENPEEPESEKQTGVEEEEKEPAVPKKVKIYSSRKNVVTEGERIYLTSYLEGFDGLTVSYQWQVDKGDGWEDVEGATRDSYSFIADAETILYTWRVIVYFEE